MVGTKTMIFLKGIHHVTAITSNAQTNVDFYTGVLGLRLVKKTVNFDDPGSYHLYYGDRIGSPGTLITFFEWPGATPGKAGADEPIAVACAVPEGAVQWWSKRLADLGIAAERTSDGRILVRDPDGMRVELVETAGQIASQYWGEGEISRNYAIKGIHAAVLALGSFERSHGLYTKDLTFSEVPSKDGRKQYAIGQNRIEVVTPETPFRGRMGAGTIHHVALRTDDDASQNEWLEKLNALGLNVSPVMDRKYFHSIYFRERNGVLFEIATDGPGMAVDESADHLGEALSLPREYEPMRKALERSLKPVVVGGAPTHA